MIKKTILLSAFSALILGGAYIANAHNDAVHNEMHELSQEVANGKRTFDEAFAKLMADLKVELEEHVEEAKKK
ncbi:MAG: hypothetical protein JSS34_07080 [Proteobacteria bacterium]|nr:hypothetical protein [Pseudomonadota bacterium]